MKTHNLKKHKKLVFKSFIFLLVVVMMIGAGCAPADPSQPGEDPPDSGTQLGGEDENPVQAKPDDAAEIDEAIQEMTLREKVGQMFIIRPDALDAAQTPEQVKDPSAVGVTALTEGMKTALQERPVGGIIIFAKNIADPQQITGFIGSFQSAGIIPMFVAVDEEGGRIARLANHRAFDLPQYESAAAVGQSGRASDALAMGETIGGYLRTHGFNMDFAPVADVNTNPDNPVIGDRSFSPDAGVAAEMANAMASGLKQQDIIPVFKHFPGHGDTAEDSHSGIAVSNKTKEEMRSCEWLPYQSLTGGDCVMVGHIAAPEITGDLTPASLSSQMVSDILRRELGFEGVVVTDSLDMGAVTEKYDSGEAAVAAIEAGCDILLSPENFQEAFDAVLAAVEDGTLSEQRIDESVYRIVRLKKAYGIWK